MKLRDLPTGLLLIVVLGFGGMILMYVPPHIAAQYRVVQQMNPTWATIYLSIVGAGALLLAGSSLWIIGRLTWRTFRKAERHERRSKTPSQLSADEKRHEIEENIAAVADLQHGQAADPALAEQLEPLVRQLESKREAQKLEIVAFGSISSGKSSLLNALAGHDIFATDARGGTTLERNEIPWPGADQVILVDTPGLGEVDGQQHGAVSAESAKDADLVLLVVDGPLRDTEFQLLRVLGSMEKRILLCLNKADWYDDREKAALLGQLSEQVEGLLDPQDIVAVRSRPTQRPRMRLLADGSQQAEMVKVPPDIAPLAQRMVDIVRRDGPDLLLANLLLQSRGLVQQARDRVQQSLDRHAWQTVDRYMWGAGGAAALSPLPLLDVAAGTAISIKMVLDLAQIYRQEIDLRIAIDLVGQLGKNLLGMLGVSAVTPAVTSAVASLLKTVPGVGTLAGGVLQGLVQALITRWIGAVFIEYFKAEMQEPEGGLASMARRQWQQMTTPSELRKLLQAARQHLSSRGADDDLSLNESRKTEPRP